MLPRVPWSAVLHLARLTRVVLFTALLTTPLAAQRQPAWPPLTNFLRVEAPSVVVGDEDSRGPTLFGDIRGVTLDSQGNLYVLDGSDHSVRMFDRSGRHVASVGRPGRGPGDLQDPMTLWHDGDQYLYVVDNIDGISRFLTTAAALRFERRFAVEARPTSLCGIQSELFVAGVHAGRVIQVVSPDGASLRSFGERFRRASIPSVQEQLDFGGGLAIACDPGVGRVFVAERRQSLVRGYSKLGELLWEAELPGFHGDTVRMNHPRPGVAVIWGSHDTQAVACIGDDLLLVQARYTSRRRNPSNVGALLESDHDVITWVLSASTGQVLTRQGGVPFLALARGGITAGYVREPVPQVLLTRVQALR